jgi:hypothetical protein
MSGDVSLHYRRTTAVDDVAVGLSFARTAGTHGIARGDRGESAEVLQHLRGMEQLTIDLKSTRMTDQSPMVDANRSSLLWQIRTAQDGMSRIPRIFSGRGGFGSLCLLSRKPVSNAAIMDVHSGPNRCGISKYAA